MPKIIKSTFAPQYEFAAVAGEFNLAGEVQRAAVPVAVKREDKTAELFNLTPAAIADATAKAAPGYMARFFPAGCDSFSPSPTSAHHCAACGIIDAGHAPAKMFAVEIDHHRGGRCYASAQHGIFTTDIQFAYKRRAQSSMEGFARTLHGKNPVVVECAKANGEWRRI